MLEAIGARCTNALCAGHILLSLDDEAQWCEQRQFHVMRGAASVIDVRKGLVYEMRMHFIVCLAARTILAG